VRTGTLAESGLVTAASAGTAGAIAAVTTTLVDVVKTRVMLAAAENAASEASAGKPEKSGLNGLVDAFGKTVRSGKESVASAATALDPLASSEKKWRKSAIAIGREVVAKKGVKGLWRGSALRGVGYI
jgi:solute carrier family 25 (mitochondrial S-adenosylmethionine transporter), member 26